jgi:hypothetical protein
MQVTNSETLQYYHLYPFLRSLYSCRSLATFRWNVLPPSSLSKNKPSKYTASSVNFCQTACDRISEDSTLHSHRRENSRRCDIVPSPKIHKLTRPPHLCLSLHIVAGSCYVVRWQHEPEYFTASVRLQ